MPWRSVTLWLRCPRGLLPRSRPGRGRGRVPSPTPRRRRVTRCGGSSPSLSSSRAPAWTASRSLTVPRRRTRGWSPSSCPRPVSRIMHHSSARLPAPCRAGRCWACCGCRAPSGRVPPFLAGCAMPRSATAAPRCPPRPGSGRQPKPESPEGQPGSGPPNLSASLRAQSSSPPVRRRARGRATCGQRPRAGRIRHRRVAAGRGNQRRRDMGGGRGPARQDPRSLPWRGGGGRVVGSAPGHAGRP